MAPIRTTSTPVSRGSVSLGPEAALSSQHYQHLTGAQWHSHPQMGVQPPARMHMTRAEARAPPAHIARNSRGSPLPSTARLCLCFLAVEGAAKFTRHVFAHQIL